VETVRGQKDFEEVRQFTYLFILEEKLSTLFIGHISI